MVVVAAKVGAVVVMSTAAVTSRASWHVQPADVRDHSLFGVTLGIAVVVVK